VAEERTEVPKEDLPSQKR